MSPIEEADEQMSQFLKDYPTFEDLENSIRNGEWQEIKGVYLDAKTGKVISGDLGLGNNWNPLLEEYGVLYIITDSGDDLNGKPSAIAQYFDFGDVRGSGKYTGSGSGREADHRHINISSDMNYKAMPHSYYDFEELRAGSWATTQRFFLYAPQKWPTINWKNNPFEVKS